jgi:hypothetical protein
VLELVRSPNLRRLTRLRLSSNNVGDQGVKRLLGWSQSDRLTHLDLESNGIGDEGGMLLAETPALAGIRWLRLGMNWGISEATRACLTERFGDRLDGFQRD